MENTQGICPKCGSEELDYDSPEMGVDTITYPYTCEDCEFCGQELFSVTFVTHQDEDGNDME
jgi:hypothetical protein